jgi:hypothetical protein
MTQQITKQNIEATIGYLNKLTNHPAEPYYKDDNGQFQVNPGVYYLQGAYGGWKLEQICEDGRGSNDPLSTGFCSKREVYYAIHNYIHGIETGLKMAGKTLTD